MADELSKFDAGSLQIGVESFAPPVNMSIRLDPDSFNVSTGINQGVGPRYGMAPIPGHADNEALTGTRLPGARLSEQAAGTGFTNRLKIFGIIPLNLGGYTDQQSRKNHYAWLVGRDEGGTHRLDVVFGSILSGGTYQHSPTIVAGLPRSSTTALAQDYEPLVELIHSLDAGKANELQDLLTLANDLTFLSSASVSVSGRDVPMKTMVGKVISAPALAKAPNVNFNLIGAFSNGWTVLGGASTEYQAQLFKSKKREMLFVCLSNTGAQLMGYTLSATPSATTYKAVLNLLATPEHLDVSAITATKIGASTSYGSAFASYVNDPDGTINSSYKAILIAADKAIAALAQEWNRNLDGSLVQWVDLSNQGLEPRTLPTGNGNTIAGRYKEKGIEAGTCFRNFPDYDPSTPMGSPTSLQVGLATSDAGLLESDTSYELTYSVYYKRLNHETNVGVPAKIRTGATGPYSLTIAEPQGPAFTNFGNLIAGERLLLDFPSGPNNYQALNFIEYRFYFRQLGTFEWRPCGVVEAADYWFGPFMDDYSICENPIGATIGGQPGGYNDYSQLPEDQYKQVLYYKDRAFWFSDKAIQMSIRKNVFSYPARNSIAAATGTYRGGTVHIQPGETVQTSRLVIWASDQTYVGRFTGILSQYPIQVSIDTIANFPLDGSDFEVDLLCEATAYSYRSAIVAEGILYFWGPQGVYADDGIDKPVKQSQQYEPNIFGLVDSNQIDKVHCIYNKQTKEILWFYQPAVTDEYPTHGLIFNTTTKEFHPTKFSGAIDAAFVLKLENDSSPIALSGERTVAIARETASSTIQRPYFFDHICRAGDIRPTTDLMVKEISTPTTGRRRLTLAAGYDAGKFATLAVGDRIALTQLKKYASTLTLGDDFIGKIAALGAGTIDITLPKGVEIDAAAVLTQPFYFPIWHASQLAGGLNGIPWSWETLYWAPGGLNFSGHWMALHLTHKINLLKSVDPQLYEIAFKSMTVEDYVAAKILLENNCDGIFQRYHNLDDGPDAANNGQAIKIKLSGYQIGSEWVLQYLQASVSPTDGNPLMEFQEGEG